MVLIKELFNANKPIWGTCPSIILVYYAIQTIALAFSLD